MGFVTCRVSWCSNVARIAWQARVNVDPRAVRIAELTRELGELKMALALRETYIQHLEEHY